MSLPVFTVLVLYAVEVGRIHLARQQLTTSLESAALAAVKGYATDSASNTLSSRALGRELAAANLVLGKAPRLSANRDSRNRPTENASQAGDLVYGALVGAGLSRFDATQRGNLSRRGGPKPLAFATRSVNGWKTIDLPNRRYTSMVVVATLNYDETNPPMVVRVCNASVSSFEYFVQNVKSGAPVPGVDVYFFVVEEGIYTMERHGFRMEARKYLSTTRGQRRPADERRYANRYDDPIVVGQVMSYNDPDWSVFWSCRPRDGSTPTRSVLLTGRLMGGAPASTRSDEMIGYVVIERGRGQIDGLSYYAGRTTRGVGALVRPQSDTHRFRSGVGTYAVVSRSGFCDRDGTWANLYGDDPIEPTRIRIALDEATRNANARMQKSGTVSYLIFSGPCAVRAQKSMELNWYFTNLFGSVLRRPIVQAEATAYYDGVSNRSRLVLVKDSASY